jgi:CO/xanthine dehydrogenase Mo-binding subunit
MNELSRREFMKAGGALVVGFSWALDGVAQRPATESAPVARTLDTNEVDGFLAVNADGTVTIFCGKVDLGQGLRIAIPQMAAEELGVDIARVTMIEGDTALTPDQGPTAGSSGIMRGGVQIRQAARRRGSADRGRPAHGHAPRTRCAERRNPSKVRRCRDQLRRSVNGKPFAPRSTRKRHCAILRRTRLSENRCRVPTCSAR